MISVKIPLMTKIGEPDVNGRVIPKEAFQKYINSGFYKEMISTGNLRLVYGGAAGEFLDKEHFCVDLPSMDNYILGDITEIDEESVTANIYCNEDIFLSQIECGFKVYLVYMAKLDVKGAMTNMKIMYCSMGPDIISAKKNNSEENLYLFGYTDEIGKHSSFIVAGSMNEAIDKFAEKHRHHVIGNVSGEKIEIPGYKIKVFKE